MLEAFIESTAKIDPGFPTLKHSNKMTKMDVASCKDYQKFLKGHCVEGQY